MWYTASHEIYRRVLATASLGTLRTRGDRGHGYRFGRRGHFYLRKLEVGLATVLLVLLPAQAFAAVCQIRPFNGNPAVNYTPEWLTLSPARVYGCSSFTLAASCKVSTISMQVTRDSGAASDGLPVLRADNAGSPQTASTIETCGQFPAISAFPTYTWATSTCSGATTLTAGTTYWLCADTAGNHNTASYYMSADPTGSTLNWNGSVFNTFDASNKFLYSIDGIVTAANVFQLWPLWMW